MPKISALPAIVTPDSLDELAINDVSATTTKKITLAQVKTNTLEGYFPNYSASEVAIGETWVDGRPIYRKVIRTAVTVAIGPVNVAHGITSITNSFEILRCDGSFKLSVATNNGKNLALPYYREQPGAGNWIHPTSVNDTNIVLTASYAWGSTWCTFILEYVK